MSLIESWFPQATQPTRSADSWAGKPPGSVPKGSAQEAALKDPVGFRKQLQMVEVQTGAPTDAKPEGTWAWRLQHPEHQGQFYNFQPGERMEKGKSAGMGDVSDRALQREKRLEFSEGEGRKAQQSALQLKLDELTRSHQTTLEQLRLQGQAQQNSLQLGLAQLAETKAGRADAAAERKDEREYRKNRDVVLDQRYIDEIAQRNKLTEYGFQVAAYNARAQRRGDLFNFIGNALRGLTA